jgi:hypothetical protein
MRKQTGSAIFAASHSGKQHESPPEEIDIGHSTNGEAPPVVASLWKNVNRCGCITGEFPSLRALYVSGFRVNRACGLLPGARHSGTFNQEGQSGVKIIITSI